MIGASQGGSGGKGHLVHMSREALGGQHAVQMRRRGVVREDALIRLREEPHDRALGLGRSELDGRFDVLFVARWPLRQLRAIHDVCVEVPELAFQQERDALGSVQSLPPEGVFDRAVQLGPCHPFREANRAPLGHICHDEQADLGIPRRGDRLPIPGTSEMNVAMQDRRLAVQRGERAESDGRLVHVEGGERRESVRFAFANHRPQCADDADVHFGGSGRQDERHEGEHQHRGESTSAERLGSPVRAQCELRES